MSGKLDENQEEEKKRFLEEFKELSDSIMEANDTTIKSEDVMKQEQFERALDSFRKKYKEEPTPQEYEEMKTKIFGK